MLSQDELGQQKQNKTLPVQVMVQHLQRQLAQREAEVDQMSGLQKRDADLQHQVETLQEKLREAKRTQAPVSHDNIFM